MWIIQNKIFGEETKSLIESLEKANIKYKIGYDYNYYEHAIIRGSIDFVKEVDDIHKKFGLPYNHTKLSLDNYDCHKYYRHFGLRMLNNDYIILPWWDLPNKKDLIFNIFPGEKVFIRPNSGKKIFTGTTVWKKWFEKELLIIKDIPFNKIKDDDLILISSCKEILSEYRLLFHKNKLIDWTQYNGESHNLDKLAIGFFSTTIDYFPDDFYTLDLTKTNDSYKILELNSFCSAGLYDMNFDKVVKEVV